LLVFITKFCPAADGIVWSINGSFGQNRESFRNKQRIGRKSMVYRLNSKKVTEATEEWLAKRGVAISEIAELVMMLQKDYFEDLSMEECEHNVRQVLSKREVQNAILTGIQLDMLCEQ